MKTYKQFLTEKATTATIKNVLFGDFDDAKKDLKKHKIKAKVTGGGDSEHGEETLATLTGEKKDLIAYLSSDAYGFTAREVKKEFPELFR